MGSSSVLLGTQRNSGICHEGNGKSRCAHRHDKTQ
ncbi:rCG44695 [Rattus norvegicus]|uniref:RCG44695 n=1 Tax=Rattus norvegicus TaxID=10116 RepID=A6I5K5_RAT|nr:rCG44695 [Rattus norvegicus]